MRGIPLFPGDSEIDQIFKIFRSVGLFGAPHLVWESASFLSWAVEPFDDDS